ncbi:hypothetical protein JCM3765_003322 [Sporobolomyces pararoseus]
MQPYPRVAAPPCLISAVPWDDIEDVFGVLKRLNSEWGVPPFLCHWITAVRNSLEMIWPFVDRSKQWDCYEKLKSIPTKVFRHPAGRLDGTRFSLEELFERALPPLDYIKTWVDADAAARLYLAWYRRATNPQSPFVASSRDTRSITRNRLEQVLEDIVLCFPPAHKGVEFKPAAEAWVQRFRETDVYKGFMGLEDWRKRIILDELSDVKILNAIARARTSKVPIDAEKILPEIEKLKSIAGNATLDSASTFSQHAQAARPSRRHDEGTHLQMQYLSNPAPRAPYLSQSQVLGWGHPQLQQPFSLYSSQTLLHPPQHHPLPHLQTLPCDPYTRPYPTDPHPLSFSRNPDYHGSV